MRARWDRSLPPLRSSCQRFLSVVLILADLTFTDSRLRGAARPAHLRRDRAVGQPGLFGDRIGDLPGAALDDAECGVDQLVVLNTATKGLRLHPGDDALARLERGFGLHGPDHVFVVQVTVAEVESEKGVSAELPLP